MKILGIRSGRDWVLNKALEDLEKKYGDFELHMISNSESNEFLVEPSKLYKFEIGKSLSPFSLGVSNYIEIFREKYDLVFAIYMNDAEIGYQNINILLKSFNIKEKQKFYRSTYLVDDYNQRYKDGYWNTTENIFKKEYLETLLKVMKIHKKKNLKLLDLGCGPGDLTQGFSWIQNVDAVGLDYSIEGLKFGRRKDNKEKLLCADALNLPLKEKSFDIIVARAFSLVEMDTNEMGKKLQYWKRFLKKDGKFLMINPAINMSGKKTTRVEGRTLSEKQIRTMFKNAGMKNIKIFFSKEKDIEKYRKKALSKVATYYYKALAKIKSEFYVNISFATK